jgi:hypothetical protein
MKPLLTIAGVLTLALAVPALADPQDRGNGNGHGRGHERGSDDNGRRGDDNGRGRGSDDGPRSRGRDDGEREVRRVVREVSRGPDVERIRVREREDDRRRDDRRGDDRDVRLVVRESGPVVIFDRDRDRDRRLIVGCPPGLARKDNGCMPPGQARKYRPEYVRYDYLWDRRDDGYRYRYDDGYLYRYNPQGSMMGYLPLLGGALSLGNVWPAQYQYTAAPAYYTDYYRLNDRYDYRYADGVLYGLDPQTQAIGQVAALLTGQSWNVGQAMPSGYDVYNVPYGYRDRYYDTPEHLYRYSDGYVYQVDPTTQLVQAAIQLLT